MVTKLFKKLGDFVLILVNLVFGTKTHDFISLTLQKNYDDLRNLNEISILIPIHNQSISKPIVVML